MYFNPFGEAIWSPDPGSPSNIRRRIIPGESIPIEVQRESTKKEKINKEDSGVAEDSKEKKGPRVVNIPIHVEPRDSPEPGIQGDYLNRPSFNNATGSMYKRPFMNNEHNYQNAFESDARQRASSFGQHYSRNSPEEELFRTHSFKNNLPSFRTRHRSGDQNVAYSSEQNYPSGSPTEDFPRTRTRHRSGDQAMPSKMPHVTKVFVNKEDPTPQKSSPTEEVPPKNAEQAQHKALLKIKAISKEIQDLREKVDNFTGNSHDKQYRFLDEMLTRCMINLDNVDTEGIDEIRQARKAAIRQVEEAISTLESRAGKNQVVDSQEDRANEIETNEVSNEEVAHLSEPKEEEKMDIDKQNHHEDLNKENISESREVESKDQILEPSSAESQEPISFDHLPKEKDVKMEVEESLPSAPQHSENPSCTEVSEVNIASPEAETLKDEVQQDTVGTEQDNVAVQDQPLPLQNEMESSDQKSLVDDSSHCQEESSSLPEDPSHNTPKESSTTKRTELTVQLEALPSQEKMEVDETGQQSNCDGTSTTL